MFWCAFVYAAVGSWLTHLIGRRLIASEQQTSNATKPTCVSMGRVRENAESIALYNGEPNENRRLSNASGWSGTTSGTHARVQAPDVFTPVTRRLRSSSRLSLPGALSGGKIDWAS